MSGTANEEIEKMESLTVSTDEGTTSRPEDETGISEDKFASPQYVDGDYEYGDGDGEYEYYGEGEYEYGEGEFQYRGEGNYEAQGGEDGGHDNYGYEEHVPRQRRSSIVGHIMAWAGAVNQEYYDSQLTSNPNPSPRPQPENRRASMDQAGRPVSVVPIRSYRQRCHSSDEVEVDDLDDPPDEGARRMEDYPQPEFRVPRRNSLHAMVERAMAFVNLKSDRDADDLCPFGTRRDSLFS
jgi:hypothetical protein